MLEEQQGIAKNTAQLDLLRSVVDQLPIGVAIVDRASRKIVIKNRRIRELMGNSADALNSLDDIPEVFGTRPDGTLLRRIDCPLSRAVEHGEIVVEEPMIYDLGEGGRVAVSISASPIRSSNGAHLGAVVLYRSISNLALAHSS